MVESTKLGRGVGCCWQGWRGGCPRGIDPRVFISNRCVSLKVSRNCLLLQMTHIAVSLTCVDAPSVARGKPFARGFRLIDAGLKEYPYFICHNAVGVSFMPFYNYSDKILPNLCKGVARSKGFFNPARLLSRDSWGLLQRIFLLV